MNTQLIAYLGKPELKEQVVELAKWHQEQDKIIQGTYGDNGKYCAVGCTLNSLNKINHKRKSTSEHIRYETELGIPRVIARLEDKIFEGLAKEDALKFPVEFLEAVNVGADLSKVSQRFLLWLLVDETDGVIKYAREDGKVAIRRVADLYERALRDEVVTLTEWQEAASAAAADAASAASASAAAAAAAADAAAYAAYAAAAYAADAAYAAAASAAADAAYAAAAYAAYAADAAYAAAASAAARYKSFERQSEKLLELIRDTK